MLPLLSKQSNSGPEKLSNLPKVRYSKVWRSAVKNAGLV